MIEQEPEISLEQQLNLKVNDILQNSEWEDMKSNDQSRQMRERQVMVGRSHLHVVQTRLLDSPDAITSIVLLSTTGEDGLPRTSVAEWQINSNAINLDQIKDWPIMEAALDMAVKVVEYD